MKRILALLAILSFIPLVAHAKGVPAKPDPLFVNDTTYYVGDETRSVAAADLDGDGDLDLAASYRYYDHVAVLLNNGDGTYADAVHYPSGPWGHAIWADDLDGDGDADLAVVADYPYDSFNLFLLFNNGDATFGPHVTYETAVNSMDVLAADFDADEDLDVAVVSRGNQGVLIFTNQGDGNLDPPAYYWTGGYPDAVFAIDLDDDQDLDVIASGYHVNDVFILLNNGDGTFADTVAYPSGGSWCRSVTAADFDGDGDPDIATANSASDNLSILKNRGDGTFMPAIIVEAGDGPYSIYSADLDMDGDPDLAVSNGQMPDKGRCTWSHFDNKNGAFRSATDYEMGDCPAGVIAADVDGDLDLEVVVAARCDDEMTIFFNTTRVSCCMIRGDVDNSGQLDALDLVYLSDYFYQSGPEPPCMDEADADGDGDVDEDDLYYLVAYFWEGGPAPVACPDAAE